MGRNVFVNKAAFYSAHFKVDLSAPLFLVELKTTTCLFYRRAPILCYYPLSTETNRIHYTFNATNSHQRPFKTLYITKRLLIEQWELTDFNSTGLNTVFIQSRQFNCSCKQYFNFFLQKQAVCLYSMLGLLLMVKQFKLILLRLKIYQGNALKSSVSGGTFAKSLNMI